MTRALEDAGAPRAGVLGLWGLTYESFQGGEQVFCDRYTPSLRIPSSTAHRQSSLLNST